jgi:hypothetical protein
MNSAVTDPISVACRRMASWLQSLPEWPVHPTNPSASVSAHFGPTVLSEHDCVLHFARFLAEAGVPWEDMHLELSPGQWMYERAASGAAPKRIDLAIVQRDQLAHAGFPVPIGQFRFQAVFEFALASNYWQFGTGSPRALLTKVACDVMKVADYLATGLSQHGYVVVIEECDHRFPTDYARQARETSGVEVLLHRRWA